MISVSQLECQILVIVIVYAAGMLSDHTLVCEYNIHSLRGKWKSLNVTTVQRKPQRRMK